MMKLFGKNFATQFSDRFFDALCDDSVTLSELDELALTEKTIQALTSFDKHSMNTWLKMENTTAESLLCQRDDRGKQLRLYAEKLGFPIEDSFTVCQKISEQTEYTEDLSDFLRYFLPSHQFILNPTMEKNESDLEQVSNYALILDEIAQVDRTLTEIETLWENWLPFKNKLLCPDQSTLSKTRVTAGEVLKICKKHLKLDHETPVFSYNLESILGELNHTPAFRKVAPLYLFKVLVKHKSRLQKNRDITINLASLWKFDVYAITQDNGRNFNTNRHYIDLFLDLCNLWSEDPLVDMMLSRWGFYQTSNLLEFDRNTTEDALSFPLFDQLLEASFFSCYRCGGYDAILLKELNIPLEKVLFFQSMPHYQGLLAEISAYLHENANEWVERFLLCPKSDVAELCMALCRNSQSPKEQITLTKAQLNLILCAINLALQEAVDSFGKEYLIQWLIRVFRGDSS